MAAAISVDHIVGGDAELYRHDGVRITHDPFEPGMAEKYGTPGQTDNEGFDPYRDSVGAGIYGGIVQRDAEGIVRVGRQYQDHNPRPGPIYAGGGYAPSAEMLADVPGKLIPLLDKYPDLVNDVTTGGAQPLHMCGMSARNQGAVAPLVKYGADIEALDTYGMTPLHRMASNNLHLGAAALIAAGADLNNPGLVGSTPLSVAQSSRARNVLEVLEKAMAAAAEVGGTTARLDNVLRLNVLGSSVQAVNGDYIPQDPASKIPSGFRKVCEQQLWDTGKMWRQLNGVDPAKDIWFSHSENDSYIYFNKSDGKWWIDGPDGNGVFIALGPWNAPPAHGWGPVGSGGKLRAPMVRTFREVGQ